MDTVACLKAKYQAKLRTAVILFNTRPEFIHWKTGGHIKLPVDNTRIQLPGRPDQQHGTHGGEGSAMTRSPPISRIVLVEASDQ